MLHARPWPALGSEAETHALRDTSRSRVWTPRREYRVKLIIAEPSRYRRGRRTEVISPTGLFPKSKPTPAARGDWHRNVIVGSISRLDGAQIINPILDLTGESL